MPRTKEIEKWTNKLEREFNIYTVKKALNKPFSKKDLARFKLLFEMRRLLKSF